MLPIPLLDLLRTLLLSCCIFLHDEPLGGAAEFSPAPLDQPILSFSLVEVRIKDSSFFLIRYTKFLKIPLSSVLNPHKACCRSDYLFIGLTRREGSLDRLKEGQRGKLSNLGETLESVFEGGSEDADKTEG